MTETLSKQSHKQLNSSKNFNILGSISIQDKNDMNTSFESDLQENNLVEIIELLKLEVRQLKRQNQFLKTKIKQLKSQIILQNIQSYQKPSLNFIGIQNQEIRTQIKIQYDLLQSAFMQLQNLLKSLSSFFKVYVDLKIQNGSQEDPKDLENPQGKISELKFNEEYKKKINRKLQMISLQHEQKRLETLLQLFMDFYKTILEDQKLTQNRVKKIVEKTIEIKENLIKKANESNSQKFLSSKIINSPIQSQQIKSLQQMISQKQNNLQSTNILQKSQLKHDTNFTLKNQITLIQ